MLKNIRKNIPLMIMTLIMTVFMSYSYIRYIQSETSFIMIVFLSLLSVAACAAITYNVRTLCVTGGIILIHVLSSFIKVPLLHSIAIGINECAIDTVQKVFWTDRGMFYNDTGSCFFIIFVICFSLYVTYVSIKSISASAFIGGLYIFFMEFYYVSSAVFVTVNIFILVTALLVLYMQKWVSVSENAQKRKIGIMYGIPLLCCLLAFTIMLTFMRDSAGNQDVRAWIEDTAYKLFSDHKINSYLPDFRTPVFEKYDGSLGGDVSFSNIHMFSVSARFTTLGGTPADRNLYLRGAACDSFEDDKWKIYASGRDDRLLSSYFNSNKYFCFDGNANALNKVHHIWQNSSVTVYYDSTGSSTIFNHTYTTDISMTKPGADVFYDEADYTYQKDTDNVYTIMYDGFTSRYYVMDEILNIYGDNSFSSADGISKSVKNKLKKYYLKVPDEMRDSVKKLADEITKGQKGDYRKAYAIEEYLKNNYEYTLTPGPVPDGGNLVEHFLFGNKKGYCVYFASAMVMLCRTEGIPARYVKGYRIDNLIDNNRTSVTDANSHAWVEVWVPELGWTTFDPVASASFMNNASGSGPSVPPVTIAPVTPAYQSSPSPSPSPKDSGGAGISASIPTGTSTPTSGGPTVEGEGPTSTPSDIPSVSPTASQATEPPSASPSPTSSKPDAPYSPTASGENSAVRRAVYITVAALIVCAVAILIIYIRYSRNSLSKNGMRLAGYNAAVKIFRAVVSVETFLGMPMYDGETAAHYFMRINNPAFNDMARALEQCFYNDIPLTDEQYAAFRSVILAEEQRAAVLMGRMKWILWKLGRKKL